MTYPLHNGLVRIGVAMTGGPRTRIFKLSLTRSSDGSATAPRHGGRRGVEDEAFARAAATAGAAAAAATGALEDRLKKLRPGQLVTISGYLVDVRDPGGFRWSTSMSRSDTGDGACELVWVESLAVE